MGYVMSMDGGGSKLLCLISDENGNLVGRGMGGQTNTHFCGYETFKESILEGVTKALRMAGIEDLKQIHEVNAALIADREKSREFLESILIGVSRINLHSEYDLSIMGAIQEREGGLVQAGTGSFACLHIGEYKDKVGGWGVVAGDEGSGYYIGRKALRACARMRDGLGKPTIMRERILQAYNIKHLGQYVAEIDQATVPQHRLMLARLCPMVGQCADEGDEVAIDILRQAGRWLALMMATLVKRSGMKGVKITVSGGVWKTSHYLYSSFRDFLFQEVPDVNLMPPLFEPAVGGILMGLENLGVDIKSRLPELKQILYDFMYDPGLFPELQYQNSEV